MQPAAGAAPPVPGFFEFSAPADWRAIDLISDLHLAQAAPGTFEAFAAYLRDTDADAVWILGDLFELWVGDDGAARPFESRCVDLLAAAARRRCVGFMAGNRDFLVGTALLQATGMMALPDPTRLDAWGLALLLSHGDALCLADAPYQAFRAQVRSPAWQASFLARPLDERLHIGRELRGASDARRRMGNSSADVDADEARRWLTAADAAVLLHGHTHRPGNHDLGAGLSRRVLSDWDFDSANGRPRGDRLRITRAGVVRLPLLPAAAG